MARGASRSASPPPGSIDEKKKRKAEPSANIASKKRRPILGPLIPFSKGPIYEDVIGMRDYGLFNDHSIYLFNGKPIWELLNMTVLDQVLIPKIPISALTLSLSSPGVLRTLINSWSSPKLTGGLPTLPHQSQNPTSLSLLYHLMSSPRTPVLVAQMKLVQ